VREWRAMPLGCNGPKSGALSRSRNRLHELHGFHTKGMRKSNDVEQADVAFAALDSPDIVSV